MKTQQTDQRWDDIVFENRNKYYGAYAIRQSYPSNVLRALLLCGGAVACVYLLPSQSSVKNIDSKIIPDIPGLIAQPIIKTEVKPKEVTPIKKTKSTLVPTKVTTSDVPDVKVENDDITLTNSSTDNLNGSDIEIVNGNGQIDVPVEPVPVKAPPFVIAAEVMPTYEGRFPAMMKFIQNKMNHSLFIEESGTVYVSFVVSTTGAITNVELVKGIDRRCDQEAMRVISLMTKWKPGMQAKVPVAVKMVLPIKFVSGE